MPSSESKLQESHAGAESGTSKEMLINNKIQPQTPNGPQEQRGECQSRESVDGFVCEFSNPKHTSSDLASKKFRAQDKEWDKFSDLLLSPLSKASASELKSVLAGMSIEPHPTKTEETTVNIHKAGNSTKDNQLFDVVFTDEMVAKMEAHVRERLGSPLVQSLGVDETAVRVARSFLPTLQSSVVESGHAENSIKFSSALMARYAREVLGSDDPSINADPSESRHPDASPTKSTTDTSDGRASEQAPMVEMEEESNIVKSQVNHESVCQPKFNPNPPDRKLHSIARKAVDILTDQYGHDPRWSKSDITRAAWASDDLLSTLQRIDDNETTK